MLVVTQSRPAAVSAMSLPLPTVCDPERAAYRYFGGLQLSDVSSIRGAMIFGRNRGYDGEKLRRLKWMNHGGVEFFTYDDLLSGLVNLVRTVTNL